jgi:hypothetical protein
LQCLRFSALMFNACSLEAKGQVKDEQEELLLRLLLGL